jgi:superfamily II RNA helicase
LFNKLGAPAHFQSKMFREIAEESIKSTNSLLQNIKGTVHIKNEKESVIALSIVKNFFEQFQMENILAVFSAEIESDNIKTDPETVLSFLDYLIEIGHRLKTATFHVNFKNSKKIFDMKKQFKLRLSF